VQGWIAGVGFEDRPELLEQGAALLPLLGTSGAAVRRVRDPKTFFAALDAFGIGHPEVRHEPAPGLTGWLLKDFGASGATHIRRVPAACPLPEAPSRPAQAPRPLKGLQYLQAQAPGAAMSASFIANGRRARLLGCNEQLVRPFGRSPYRFHGVVGPVGVPAAVRLQIARMLDALTEEFALRGLASLDFLLDGERVDVLELNPRPSASMVLYPTLGGSALLHAHLQACAGAALPELPSGAALAQGAAPCVRGSEIVFAPRSLRLSGAAQARLAALPAIHDLPHAPAGADAPHFERDAPLCSVSASGADAASVKRELARRRDAVLQTLETLP
jgi:uncharacterized protein